MSQRIAMSQSPVMLPYERGSIEAGETASGQEIRIPYLIKKGRTDGPCLWVNAAVHGDEINGVFAAQRFFQRLDPETMIGSVIVTPVANVLAFEERRKTTLVDGIDMDQSFPGRADGFATERAAAALFGRFAKTADVVINIHTLGTPFNAAPYAVYKIHPQARVSEAALLAHIACFEPTVACQMPVADASGELPGNIAGALDYQALSLGAIAFMVELGGGGRLENDFVEQGVTGLIRLASKMGILPPSPDLLPSKVRQVTKRAHRLARAGGLFEPAAAPGTIVNAGASIGQIRNLFGDVIEVITVEVDSWVIAVRRDPVVHSGDRVAFLATKWSDVNVEA
ncbi:peptidase M14 [Mesorhizobium sp. M3A.F.Ca.ET.174.01.1.1]|uniref:M14 family metallopeptidase n=1 Tax=unclassified Mesorhizobium TaxID=325217 RepID=UPI00109388D0|nr:MULTISPECIES: M14 family metallopeptidase [unclassified Mesorhizobium]TGS87417.1 peptidase M14 [Mesorhizobium sp. M3A.F.Ca.ET.175.01.1.1]TGT27877.1 peptidase M14 [Mesorhizobium sp. M3A.F.Ca.ET.174.01.1.1]